MCMVGCGFCEREFNSDKELYIHWKDQHEDELSSDQKEKVKAAEKENSGNNIEEMADKKDLVFKGLISVLIMVIAAILIPQMLQEAPETTQNERAGFNLTGQPALGDSEANITVIEFSDYKCPACKRFEEQVKPRIEEEYIETGEVKFYFLNYPFLNTAGDSSTAVAGECMYRQDNDEFWDFHSAIYENQGSEREDWATEDELADIAESSTGDINYTRLRNCIDQKDMLNEVNRDKTQGIEANVGRTPTVFVNGVMASEPTYTEISSLIQEESDRQ